MPARFSVKPLDETTWPDFAELVEAHNGVWGGCWCMAFHLEGGFGGRTPQQNRSDKKALVCSDKAHAALVYDGSNAVGWCQFGPPMELPRIKNKREYLARAKGLPDWRITCFFVHRDYRRRGVATTALTGALDLIARRGGGTVESYPQAGRRKTISSGFLHNGTLAMFERAGFKRSRRLGKDRWVVIRRVRMPKD